MLKARFAASALLLCVHALGFAQTGRPVISAIGNAASYGTGRISPGEMVVIFGVGIGPAQLVNLQLTADGTISTTLAGVQVLFNGVAAPLIYVSATQVAAMVPYGMSGQSSAGVQAVFQGNASAVFQTPVARSAPGIFTADASGKGQAAATNADGSLNSSGNPASPGSYVTLYLTGEGQTNPPGSDGHIATAATDLTLPIIASIGGHSAQVLYAGSAPGNVNGFAQINLIVPGDLPYGGNLPLLIQIGGASSQAGITLAVAGSPAPLPGTPLNAMATVNVLNQIIVTWTPADALATRFHIERQTGTAGVFTEIAATVSSLTSYTDVNVTLGTTYPYRIRAENDNGFSGYSNVATATVPMAPGQLLPPSNLQAIAVNQTQVTLSWNPANTNATAFQIEKKVGLAGVYAPLVTLSYPIASYVDLAVTGGNTYVYRMRSQGSSGFSAYSNEATVSTTATQLPAAPTNLQAMLTSTTQVNLTWVNNSLTATAIRIEVQTGTSGAFQDIGPATTLTASGVSGLQPDTTYSFRVRAQQNQSYSPYSNVVTVTTSQRVVLVLHGILQTNIDIQGLQQSLQASLPGSLFFVDAGFSYGDCTTKSCLGTCTIPNGAIRLALYIQQRFKPAHLLIVGYSLGGLIARDLLINNYGNILSTYHVDGLITLGTPHLGYPYEPIDDTISCSVLDQQMVGNYRDSRGYVWSSYLSSLNTRWSSAPLPGGTLPWLAIAGTSCNSPFALTASSIFSPFIADARTGCRDSNPSNDNVVCEDSALFDTTSIGLLTSQNTPTQRLYSDQYAHRTGNLFDNLFVSSLFANCSWVGKENLSNPNQNLISEITRFLSSH